MQPEPDVLQLAEALERAYRLALAVEALAPRGGDDGEDPSITRVANELLGVLDQARASMLRPGHGRQDPSASYSQRPTLPPRP
ncbi:hypothetical protein [Hydrogenophaga laconesensis]|uniref:Uncharacterized protein n=1 Tax=Hydrogenophaga laconesensis TaxID=1805971 RepID=A0ABU1VH37_9BURK|nr:hypothetical protein [Hydrogenophaga laconesensis]MDR7096790.1 hypothetical protein [Hydrogenophaga laconesensis]